MGAKKSESDQLIVQDEPGMAERFQRGLRRALSAPPQHRDQSTRKLKGRITKGRSPPNQT